MSTEEKKVILKTEGLTKHYGGVKALENADFTLSNGEHVAIVGDNGAGKSTFIRQVTGVEIPTSGKIYFDGDLVNFKTPSERNMGIDCRSTFVGPHDCMVWIASFWISCCET